MLPAIRNAASFHFFTRYLSHHVKQLMPRNHYSPASKVTNRPRLFRITIFFAILMAACAEVWAIGLMGSTSPQNLYFRKGQKGLILSFVVINNPDNNGDGIAEAFAGVSCDPWYLRFSSLREFYQVDNEMIPRQNGMRMNTWVDATNLHVGRTYYVLASGACDEAAGGSIGGRACIRAGTQYLHIVPYDIPVNACLAVGGSGGTVELQWDRPSALACPIDHYALFRSDGDTIQISQLAMAKLVSAQIDSATFQWRLENAPRGINSWYAVVAYDPTGEAVGISKNIRPFHARPGFSLVSPADGMRISSDSPRFSWAGGEPPFTLWLSDSPTFSVYHEFSSIMGQTFTPPVSLDDRKVWYWKVIDSRYVVSDESAWSFRTNLHPLPPAQVQLLGPISNEKVMSYRPSFSWSQTGTAADSIVYHLLIGDDPGLSSTILDVHTTAPFFNMVDSLTDNHTFYWKVQATGEGGTSPWSNVESFHLEVPDAPSPVMLIYPSWSQSMSGGPEAPFESGLYPTFRWSRAIDPDLGDQITYTLWYATDESFSDKVEVTALADTQYTPVTALSEDKIYYWKVFAVDQTGRSTVSIGKPYGFVTNSENRQPTVSDLVDPIGGALLNYRDVVLRWSSVEDDLFDLKLYTLHVSTQRDMADTLCFGSRMMQNDYTLQNLADRVYYWRVTVNSVTCAGLDGGTSQSRVDSFEVYNGLVTAVTSPVANEILESGTVKTIQWTTIDVDSVAIDYTTDHGWNYGQIVASCPAAPGKFKWTVPYTSSPNCFIRVSDRRRSWVKAYSDGRFTIRPGTPMLTDIVPRNLPKSTAASVHVLGYKLPSGILSLKLSHPGRPDIIARDIVPLSATMVSCIFDLPDTTGLYDLVAVTDAGMDTIPAYMTVQRKVSADSGWAWTELMHGPAPLSRVLLADLDRNGVNEIYCNDENGTFYQVLHADTGWVSTTIASGLSWRNMAAGDADNDGRSEIYGTTTDYRFIRLSPKNDWQPVDMGPAISDMGTMTIADGNLDGNFEIYSGSDDGMVRQWSWNGSGFDQIDVGQTDAAISDIAVGDGNNDHEVEIYCAGGSGIITSFKFDRSGFVEYVVADQGEHAEHHTVTVADGNNDSLLEVYASCLDGKLYQFRAGSGNSYLASILGTAGYSATAGDVDGDGRQELYTAGVTRFDWNGAAWEAAAAGGSSDRYLATGDGDNDGALELFATTSDGRLLMYKVREPGPAQLTAEYVFSAAGWHLLSLAAVPPDSTILTLFPEAIGSKAFSWDSPAGSYFGCDTLKPGVGYWLAAMAGSSSVTGIPFTGYSRQISSPGWYLIGSLCKTVAFQDLISEPEGMILAPIFGWDPQTQSYVATDSLRSQQGYWIAVNGPCTVKLMMGKSSLPKAGMLPSGTLFSNQTVTAFQKHFGALPPGPPSLEFSNPDQAVQPTAYLLQQNYPNPFNPATTIAYAVPWPSPVEIAVYDLAGRLIIQLVDQKVSAGYHSVQWQGVDDLGQPVSSGLYLVKMTTKNYVEYKKMLLIR